MRNTTRTTLATLVMLACASLAHAGEKTVDNLTIFTATKAASPEAVLKANAARFGLPANLNNLVLVSVKESLTGKHYHYQQMLRGLPVDRRRVQLWLLLLAGFVGGGVLGTWLYHRLAYQTLYLPALATGATGLLYTIHRHRQRRRAAAPPPATRTGR